MDYWTRDSDLNFFFDSDSRTRTRTRIWRWWLGLGLKRWWLGLGFDNLDSGHSTANDTSNDDGDNKIDTINKTWICIFFFRSKVDQMGFTVLGTERAKCVAQCTCESSIVVKLEVVFSDHLHHLLVVHHRRLAFALQLFHLASAAAAPDAVWC